MVKKLLVLVLVLFTTLPAGAWYGLSWDGQLDIEVKSEPIAVPELFVIACPVVDAVITGGFLPPDPVFDLSGVTGTASGLGVNPPGEDGLCGVIDMSGGIPPFPLEGIDVLVDFDVIFEPGVTQTDVTYYQLNELGELFAIETIHIVPEPATISLLFLGAVLFRRHK